MELSRKALNIKPSSTLEITAKANALKAQGIDVVGFGAGEPDFDTPEHIKQAGIDAINNGVTKYTIAAGTVELRKAVCHKLKVENSLDYDYTDIVISNGAKHSLMNTFMALLNPGDEVIIPVPFWLSYSEMVKIADGVPVFVETKEENNFMFSREDLEAAYSPKTKAIIITSPNNPTGMVMSKDDLEMVAQFAIDKDIFVISDEIYEHLIYEDDKKHISIASLSEEIKKRTIVINGVSKSYAMTGWRIGYMAAPAEIAKLAGSLQSHMASNPNAIAQRAATVALTGPQECVEFMRLKFKERRDYIYNRVSNIPHLRAKKPEGAFYLFINVEDTYSMKHGDNVINSAADFAKYLLESKYVAVVPCADFGMSNYIRLSYPISIDEIKKGMDRIEEFVNELK